MSIAALYDIHGNLPALEAVLDEIRRLDVEQIGVGGDVVIGTIQRDCMALLRHLEIPAKYISGNSERVVLAMTRGLEPSEVPLAYGDVIDWSVQQLTLKDSTWIASWQETLRMTADGIGDVLVANVGRSAALEFP